MIRKETPLVRVWPVVVLVIVVIALVYFLVRKP
jgi:hypothetical protein